MPCPYSHWAEKGRDFFGKLKYVSVAKHYDFSGSNSLPAPVQRKEELFEDYCSLRQKKNQCLS
jgi:hypothetical protein